MIHGRPSISRFITKLLLTPRIFLMTLATRDSATASLTGGIRHCGITWGCRHGFKERKLYFLPTADESRWSKVLDADIEISMDFYEAQGLPTPIGRTDKSIPVILSQYNRGQEDTRWTWDPDCSS